ncbi:MAG TPA: MoaD/ThiS family protein [Armatimonadota bacterium]|jgi:molybdopterin converting factor small subunit
MSLTIHLSAPLRPFAEGQATVSAAGDTVGEALAALVAAYPDLGDQLFDPQGALLSEPALYLNDDPLRLQEGLGTLVEDGDQLTLIAPLAAGLSGP